MLFPKLKLTLILVTLSILAYAVPKTEGVFIDLEPNKGGWVYDIGEKVSFLVEVKSNDEPIEDIAINYTLGREGIKPYDSGVKKLINGKAVIIANPLTEPGFLKCIVTLAYKGKKYRKIATVGFQPYNILTTSKQPIDFLEFWQKEIAKLKRIPLDPKLELMKDKSNDSIDVYHVSFQNNEIGSRIYGVLCVPKNEDKYPAVVRFPGAGVRPYTASMDLAAKGIITLTIGIHGIPVNMDASIYLDLYNGPLNKYPHFNLDSKDNYYFKRVYLGCIRALDFIYSLPQFDGEQLAVTGSSQGGALSIVTTALDSRVKYIAAYCPALAELTGFFHNTIAGWPNLFNKSNKNLATTKDKIETAGYYDVVNFAKLIKVPGYYSWGFNDEITPPTSTYAAYNVIKAPKNIFIVPNIGHTVTVEQAIKANTWLKEKLLQQRNN